VSFVETNASTKKTLNIYHSYMQSILLQLKTRILGEDSNPTAETDSTEESNATYSKEPRPIFHSVFKLPITYLEESKIHGLAQNVSSDLELVHSQSESQPMYDILFQPSNQFAKEMIPYWSAQYTSDIEYLEHTKQVLQEIPTYNSLVSQCVDNKVEGVSNRLSVENTEKILDVWKDAKADEYFMDKYYYINWKSLHYVNTSTSFMQILSMAQILSPVFSLLLPFLFLLFPFVLLKIKGVPITMATYSIMIKTISKGHFIGTCMTQMSGPLSIEKIAYILLMGAFYGFQIYQNVRSCMRFHLNIRKINDHLFELKNYVATSIKKMECFAKLHCNKKSYHGFCENVQTHCKVLQELYSELAGVQPFCYSYSKATEIGYMLTCYYKVYSVEEYGTALQYSFGFEGYIDNLFGVWENLRVGHISYATYVSDVASSEKSPRTKITEQYYPAHLGKHAITNTCKFNKNMIISAPNAAGKTTLLKSTAINIVFSQQVGCGFYGDCSLVPYTHIHSYLNIPDTSGRDSLFQAESRRCKEIIDIVSSPENRGARHFAILDELYSGTNPKEAGKSAYAFLKYLSKYENVDFMLTTHYVYVCKKFKKSSKIANYKMGVRAKENEPGEYTFTYKLEPGISKIQGAMKILQEMDYPKEMLDVMRGM